MNTKGERQLNSAPVDFLQHEAFIFAARSTGSVLLRGSVPRASLAGSFSAVSLAAGTLAEQAPRGFSSPAQAPGRARMPTLASIFLSIRAA